VKRLRTFLQEQKRVFGISQYAKQESAWTAFKTGIQHDKVDIKRVTTFMECDFLFYYIVHGCVKRNLTTRRP
jgi:hypothetical protein